MYDEVFRHVRICHGLVTGLQELDGALVPEGAAGFGPLRLGHVSQLRLVSLDLAIELVQAHDPTRDVGDEIVQRLHSEIGLAGFTKLRLAWQPKMSARATYRDFTDMSGFGKRFGLACIADSPDRIRGQTGNRGAAAAGTQSRFSFVEMRELGACR